MKGNKGTKIVFVATAIINGRTHMRTRNNVDILYSLITTAYRNSELFHNSKRIA